MLEVHLRRFPVPLWARAREHSAALQREFALMSMSADGTAEGGQRPVPARLTELVRTLRATFGSATTAQEQQLEAALEQGLDVLDDLVYTVPLEAAEASVAIGALYDEADEHCRHGRHLLTLATPPDLVAFRRWFLGEFVGQAVGRPPTPWPDYRDGAAGPSAGGSAPGQG